MTGQLRIEITDDARSRIVAAAAWWMENRPAAPGAIVEELDQIMNLLAAQPGLGAKARDRT